MKSRILFFIFAAAVVILPPIFIVHFLIGIWYPWQVSTSEQTVEYAKVQGENPFVAGFDREKKIISEDAWETFDYAFSTDLDAIEALKIPFNLIGDIFRYSEYCYSQKQSYSGNPDSPYVEQALDPLRIELTQTFYDTKRGIEKTDLVPNGEPTCLNARDGEIIHYLHPYVFTDDSIRSQVDKYGNDGFLFEKISLKISRKPITIIYTIILYIVVVGFCWTGILLAKNIFLFCLPWLKDKKF